MRDPLPGKRLGQRNAGRMLFVAGELDFGCHQSGFLVSSKFILKALSVKAPC